MTIFVKFRNLANAAIASVKGVFNPKAPDPLMAERGLPSYRSLLAMRYWWRSEKLTRAMRHKLANDKGLMFAENPLLRGLLARQYKEFA